MDSSHGVSKRAAQAAALSILLSPGLLIIDHIHFQYNGCMYGILIASMVLARKRSTLLLSGLSFAALLCMKHIYLYLAPAYFVYLLRVYCLSPKSIFPDHCAGRGNAESRPGAAEVGPRRRRFRLGGRPEMRNPAEAGGARGDARPAGRPGLARVLSQRVRVTHGPARA